MSAPLYDVGDVVYLKESAALGLVEAVRIGTVTKNNSGWAYGIVTSSAQMSGDRRSVVHGGVIYYGEDEFVTLCEALNLAEANVRLKLEKIQAQRAALCEDG